MNFDKSIYKISLFLFFIAATFGLLLRMNFAFPKFSLPYESLIQSHSHVAFLGWGYLSVTGLILSVFISEKERLKKSYLILLSIISVSISLMSVSFPFFGYKVFSITLLSVFGISSAILSVKIYRQLSAKTPANQLIKWSLIFYLLSSLATWFIPVAVVKFGKEVIYFNSIYFYLHFLYNGFFVFALFGLWFKYFESEILKERLKHFNIFLNLLIIGTFLSYALSVLWSVNILFLNILGALSALFLIVSFIYFLKIIYHTKLETKWYNFLAVFAFSSYSLKLFAQLLSALPWLVTKSIILKRFFIIGYLHLFTLAFLSIFILLFLFLFKKIVFSFQVKMGLVLILTGVILTEFLLFSGGFLSLIFQKSIPQYNLLMFVFSLVMVIGIGIIAVVKLYSENAQDV